jgi:hypothetical protein
MLLSWPCFSYKSARPRDFFRGGLNGICIRYSRRAMGPYFEGNGMQASATIARAAGVRASARCEGGRGRSEKSQEWCVLVHSNRGWRNVFYYFGESRRHRGIATACGRIHYVYQIRCEKVPFDRSNRSESVTDPLPRAGNEGGGSGGVSAYGKEGSRSIPPLVTEQGFDTDRSPREALVAVTSVSE